MGQDCSREVTEASKHLQTALIGDFKEEKILHKILILGDFNNFEHKCLEPIWISSWFISIPFLELHKSVYTHYSNTSMMPLLNCFHKILFTAAKCLAGQKGLNNFDCNCSFWLLDDRLIFCTFWAFFSLSEVINMMLLGPVHTDTNFWHENLVQFLHLIYILKPKTACCL